MNLRKIFFFLLLILPGLALTAQESTVFTEAHLAYKRGVDFYNQGVYGLAQKEFRDAMTLLRPVNEPEWAAIKRESELFFAKCAVRLEQPEAEVMVLDFLRTNAPSPEASQAALEIGDYYFNARNYKQALVYYDMAPGAVGAARDELAFKRGYSHFVTKNFYPAKVEFTSIKENYRSQWYFPANYYYGCCTFFEGRYDEALKAFQRCEKSPKYDRIVPYNICQILFAKKQYDQVIAYGEPKAKDDRMRNRAEINQFVGKAYFEKGDYKRALPYLEFAATNGASLEATDFYQLGYAQYQNGYFQQAIDNFEQLTKQDSVLGQNGLYHLGDCYLRTNNKFAARNAFGQAASLPYDRSILEDAMFNYGKLSYELKYDRDALDAFQRIPTTSRYYEEAQTLMGEIFLNTRDYDRAIVMLENMPSRTPKLNAAYQQVCYLRGLQLYQNNMKDEARRYFNKSLDFPIDKQTAALCSYWMGVIAHENAEYVISRGHLSAFLAQAANFRSLPEESSKNMGHYVQGYNYLKMKDYSSALTNFQAAVDGLKKDRRIIQSDQIKQGVLGDAVLRAGDCHFKKNQYKSAVSFYDEAISMKYDGFEYALYQKAIIRGLQKAPLDKIIGLENLVNQYPNSQYADEALYQLGLTYQEIGKLDQAIPPLKRLVSDFRGRSSLINQALLRLGLISYNQGNTTAAINYYKQVFSNNPENIEAKDALAALEEIYIRELNRPNDYFAFLETIPGYNVSTSARDSVTYFAAESQFQSGRFQQAIDGFNNYVGTYPNGRYVLPAQFYRAESYSSAPIGRYDLAMKDYAAVVEKGPSRYYAKAAEKGALIALNLKDYTKAFELSRKWEESAESPNSRFDAQLNILRTAYLVKNSAAVVEYANKVIQSGYASNEQVATAYYYQGKVAYDQGDLSRATPSFQRVVQMSESEIMAESYHLLANILYRQKRYPEAEQLITDAIKASAGYDDWIARNLLVLSDVYLEQGDKNSASAALEAILENYRGDDPTIISAARQKYNALGGATPARNEGTRGIDLMDLDDRN